MKLPWYDGMVNGVAMDWDAARLCRRYMGLPEDLATFLGENDES